MADINATDPVVVPATGQVTYDKWYLTQLIAKIDPEKAPLFVTLRRSRNTTDGVELMKDNTKDATLNFNLDMWNEMSSTPEIATAIDAVLTALVAYAQKKNLL